jgi:hypothetical protein
MYSYSTTNEPLLSTVLNPLIIQLYENSTVFKESLSGLYKQLLGYHTMRLLKSSLVHGTHDSTHGLVNG